MNNKTFGLRVSGTLFGIIALIHFLRIVSGFTILINDWSVPLWVNWIGLAGSLFLCIWLWGLSMKGKD